MDTLVQTSDSQASYPHDDRRLTPLERDVYRCICQRGAEGATWDEIHEATGIPKGSISPRFRPLSDLGFITPKLLHGVKVQREGNKNRRQTVWVVKE